MKSDKPKSKKVPDYTGTFKLRDIFNYSLSFSMILPSLISLILLYFLP